MRGMTRRHPGAADGSVRALQGDGRGTGSGGLTVCPTCRGKGEVIYQQSFLSMRRTCTQCNGAGQMIRQPCIQCKGEGYIRSDRKLKVNIPAGVDNGTRLRLTSEGNPGRTAVRTATCM